MYTTTNMLRSVIHAYVCTPTRILAVQFSEYLSKDITLKCAIAFIFRAHENILLRSPMSSVLRTYSKINPGGKGPFYEILFQFIPCK